ncbi:MAG: hypothetical protein U9Q69_00130 [Nanoarchaeota archaeon]|nr:hypothetical protein [Nanoarchaeota archaeon]
MKKIILVLVFSMLISGCATVSDFGKTIPNYLPGIESSSLDSFLGRSGIVSMNIIYPIENEKIIYDLSYNEFSPIIKITNSGSIESRGQVCLVGLDENVFSGAHSNDCLTYSFIPVPDETFFPATLTFGPYQIIPGDINAPDFTLTAINRYTYKSGALFKPCIKKDPYDRQDCSAKLIETLNGPITITSITEKITPVGESRVKLAFVVNLKKTANGNLIKTENVFQEGAISSLNSLEKDKPKINGIIEDIPYAGDIECKETTLTDGKGALTCIVGEIDMYDETGNYLFSGNIQTPAKLTIAYSFEEVQSNKFNIQTS